MPVPQVVRLFLAVFSFTLVAGCTTTTETPPTTSPAAPTPETSTSTGPTVDARPFPREFTVDGTTFNLHQPQYESWRNDALKGRLVMSVKTGTHTDADGKTEESADYGVLEFSARTKTDKDARAVVLDNIAFDSASFPAAAARQAQYLALARKQLAATPTLTISLDQLESAVSIASVDTSAQQSVPVRNNPPDIIFSTEPALLILVDGAPALKDSGAAGVEQVINTRSLLLKSGNRWYTSIGGRWATATALDGDWVAAGSVSTALTQAKQQAVANKQVDALDDPPDALKQTLNAGTLPDIYVRTHPAELINVQGEPEFLPIPNTNLSFINNTGADVFVDGANNHEWYVLVSGRWFIGPSSKGPWAYVEPNALPEDFRNIPPENPKSSVLASIPGTPEAQESLIANSVPQMATVNRNEARLDVPYDGAPQFAAITGTTLQYAKNTPVPVIRVDADSYFAVDKGVWFTSSSASGPWAVALSVPSIIYTIPSSSPLHYVTYVQVYGTYGDEVYVGYTPGYYGTVVTNNVVVYGTGYACDPWIGAYWYGCPATYGMGVYFGWNAWVGWTFGMGWGFYDGWYGPYGPWWGPWYGPAYPWGYWGGGAAAWNVYGHWGNAAVRGTAAAWANPWTGNYGRAARGGYYNERTGGRGMGRAGVNTNIYTGTTRARAEGVRYNPETGRVVAGSGGAAANPYTDRAAAGGQRTAINTDTGRVTHTAGGAAAGDAGAIGGGTFNTQGTGGSASGAGGFHYNADTGSLHHSGVYNVNDNYYAGHDGNVYHYNDGSWDQVHRPDSRQSAGTRDYTRPSNLDPDRFARDRGNQRISGNSLNSFNRGSAMGGFNRPVGGFRSGLGARPMGGFRR